MPNHAMRLHEWGTRRVRDLGDLAAEEGGQSTQARAEQDERGRLRQSLPGSPLEKTPTLTPYPNTKVFPRADATTLSNVVPFSKVVFHLAFLSDLHFLKPHFPS
jgi:hypothetical protein